MTPAEHARNSVIVNHSMMIVSALAAQRLTGHTLSDSTAQMLSDTALKLAETHYEYLLSKGYDPNVYSTAD